ncbi:uncharacterized protein [Dysidea avara]|uniref:uncharacterized protein n=1 Tax=Dysidea avara TaxID=196820 RepID=UPI00333331DE
MDVGHYWSNMDMQEQHETKFLSLPVELLVYIVSFLPTIRDKVKLRYVSQRLRLVSETPTLWGEFIWPLFDPREEHSVMNVLKACGKYIKRMVFPDHVTPSLFKMLSHCNKVTHLSLPVGTEYDCEQLRIAVQHMEMLEKLKELTIHVAEQHRSSCYQWVEEWMKKGFVPCHLNLIADFDYEEERAFLSSLLQWNFTPLEGYISYFRHYKNFRSPLNLYPPIPDFQLVFGLTVTLPIVKPSSFGIFLDWDMATLTDCICDSKVVCKADTGVYNFFQNFVLNKITNNFNIVTEFDFAYSETLQSGNLEQVAIACPNIQRLNLESNFHCLHPLQGLRMIANHCHDLRGLNLKYISVTDMENQLGLWDILSSMSLTHLAVDVCVFHSSSDEMIASFQKFSTLQALQLQCSYDDEMCDVCAHDEIRWLLLSHFPLLQYCNLPGNHPYLIQDVINGCKQLIVLWCQPITSLLISPAFTTSLQQIYIESRDTNIPDIFMETVSAHGRLLHVALYVNSFTIQGIIILIRNSPGLLSITASASNIIYKGGWNEISAKDNLKDSLQKRFPNRKLFRVGHFTVGQGYSEILARTDLLPLWPMNP